MPFFQETNIRQTVRQDRYLHVLLKKQAQQLAGSPGWPATAHDAYEQLLGQIETDIANSAGIGEPTAY